MNGLEKQLDAFRRGAAEIITEEDLVARLRQKERLRVKLGVDPSAPDLHLGHTVPLRKLKHLQDAGHEIVFLIGDFTGRIGDPSGRSETRRQLTEEEIATNAETYKAQAFRILDPELTVVDCNSQWLSIMTFADVIHLAAQYTVARMLEREDFGNRYRAGQPIGIHEFMYPLMQGYDSVALESDVEIGGTDQKFNLLVGRQLQREWGQCQQVCLTLPILEGLDGVQKMSKSLGNHVGILEAPPEMYGKLMSLPDHLIIRYFELLTDVPMERVREMSGALERDDVNPRDLKMELAYTLTELYHGEEGARQARDYFAAVFQKGQLPQDIPEVDIRKELHQEGPVWVIRLLVELGFAASNSEARRLLQQGSVRVDGERMQDLESELELKPGMLVQVGKRRLARLRLAE